MSWQKLFIHVNQEYVYNDIPIQQYDFAVHLRYRKIKVPLYMQFSIYRYVPPSICEHVHVGYHNLI